MKKFKIGFIALAAVLVALSGCTTTADTKESDKVRVQQDIYASSQPIPQYDWSLARHLWVQFYDAQNQEITTFSYIRPMSGGNPVFDCASMGYALPRDTQLTNPVQKIPNTDSVIVQAEPNGLFTSENTDQTVVFCLNEDGTVSPVTTEEKVTAFPFPVKWEVTPDYPQGHFVRVGTDSTVSLNPKK